MCFSVGHTEVASLYAVSYHIVDFKDGSTKIHLKNYAIKMACAVAYTSGEV